MVIGLGLVVWLLGGMLLPFVAGLAVAYLLEPLVQILSRRWCSRVWATTFILLVFILGFIGALWLWIPVLISEIGALATMLSNYIDRLSVIEAQDFGRFAPVIDYFRESSPTVTTALSVSAQVTTHFLAGGQAVLSTIAFLALMPLVAFYMMVEWPRILSVVEGLLPLAQRAVILDLVGQMNRRIAGFVRGQILVCLILAVYYSVGLSLVGFSYGVVVGVVSGILSIIPFVGSMVALISVLTIGLFEMGFNMSSATIGLYQAPLDSNAWFRLLAPLGVIAVGQFVEGNFITPKVVGDRVGLHPLWVIFALLAGAHVLGLLGMLIAVPVAAVIAVLLGYSIDQYKASPYFRGGGGPTNRQGG